VTVSQDPRAGTQPEVARQALTWQQQMQAKSDCPPQLCTSLHSFGSSGGTVVVAFLRLYCAPFTSTDAGQAPAAVLGLMSVHRGSTTPRPSAACVQHEVCASHIRSIKSWNCQASATLLTSAVSPRQGLTPVAPTAATVRSTWLAQHPCQLSKQQACSLTHHEVVGEAGGSAGDAGQP